MRKYLLPEKGKFYKANLHCHTRLSDGNLTVEEVKKVYMEKGYSIVAFTDHDLLFSHYDKLVSEDFLPITGYEVSVNCQGEPFDYNKAIHMNFFSKDPHKVAQPFFNPDCVPWLLGMKKDITQEIVDNIQVDGMVDEGENQIYPAKVNALIKVANEKGFLVTLNHPNWSLLTCNDCLQYSGLWAVEVYNHGCFAITGFPDDEKVYEEYLRSGYKIFATATDDNHNFAPFDHYHCDSFGGFTMIKSESLDYASVISAMEKGEFYASQGPEIKELYYEDGKVHIECSEARDICMSSLTRQCKRIASHEGNLTSAEFEVSPNLHGYVRFKVIDKHGKAAWTNPYYVKDFAEVTDNRVAII